MAANFEVLPYEYCLTGDVNLDGVVNILDATFLINMLLNQQRSTRQLFKAESGRDCPLSAIVV